LIELLFSKQKINQPNNQPTKQPIKQPIKQPPKTNQTTNQVDEFIKDFDERVIGAFEGILGENNLDDNTRVQVSLPMKMGGCGIRSGCVHHSAAYDNSYKQFLGKETPEQKTLSAGIDKRRKEELTAALDEENVFRLALISRERVSSWLSDVPIYGAGLEWSNVHFRVLLRWWLGLKVSEVGECNLSKCKGHMSPTGKHALACRVGGDMVTRHNRIRDCVYNIAKEGALAPVKEKYGLLSDAPENRPADIFIPSLNGINNLCLDVAVTCPLRGTFKYDINACNRYAEDVKRKRYEEFFKGVNMSYIPLVFDIYGGVSDGGRKILSDIIEEYVSREGVLSAESVWRKIMHTLFQANVCMIIRRRVVP